MKLDIHLPFLVIQLSEDLILMSVKVGVRVRPFNQKETDSNHNLCVEMMGNRTRLVCHSDAEVNHKDFTFDYSFWSHDQFIVEQNGYLAPQSGRYADQKHIFEEIGLQMLQNAWDGYHCCLFAYGQTGAGKSYSMIGKGANKGIFTMCCEQIFSQISKSEDPGKQYEVQISMMEIYNQKIIDSLKSIKQPYCKVKQDKLKGIYVEGLSKVKVESLQSIQSTVEQGYKNMNVGVTQMGKTTSRMNTIITIELRQITQKNGKFFQKFSKLQFVQLAGSQKISKVGYNPLREKQLSQVGKNLGTLGTVIQGLGQKAAGKSRHIPYRDSNLTRVLQNELGGNCKTYILCLICPNQHNYDQNLSTLRFADRARRMSNLPFINQREIIKNELEISEKQQNSTIEAEKMETFKSQVQQQMPTKTKQNKREARIQTRMNPMRFKKDERSEIIQVNRMSQNSLSLCQFPNLCNSWKSPSHPYPHNLSQNRRKKNFIYQNSFLININKKRQRNKWKLQKSSLKQIKYR